MAPRSRERLSLMAKTENTRVNKQHNVNGDCYGGNEQALAGSSDSCLGTKNIRVEGIALGP